MKRILTSIWPLALAALGACTAPLSADIVDIQVAGSHARFVWDTDVSPRDTSVNIPRNGNADLIFDQFTNETQWGEAWFLQSDFGAGLQNVLLTGGVVQNSGDFASVRFNNIENTGVDVLLEFVISAPSDGLPFIEYQASVTNNSAGNFNGSLINYFDYHLGTLADDRGEASLSGETIRTFDALSPHEEVIRQATSVNHWEIGDYDVSSVPFTGLFFELDDPLNPKLTLADLNNLPGNLGNVSAAQQWDLNLASGQSLGITGTVDVNLAAVPEPSAMIPLGLGMMVVGAAYVIRRRRKALVSQVAPRD